MHDVCPDCAPKKPCTFHAREHVQTRVMFRNAQEFLREQRDERFHLHRLLGVELGGVERHKRRKLTKAQACLTAKLYAEAHAS